ncbi:MAG: YceI family protein [Candidatus Acidiferrum sp.]|jgi:polyisoprenoid-binding protein YceI
MGCFLELLFARLCRRGPGHQDSSGQCEYRKRYEDGKLKSKDFFDVKESPLITLHSTKVVQTDPTTLELDGDFTIRDVTKPEKLTLKITGKGTGEGSVVGTMAFDRKDFGMNKGIPIIKIADRVEVTVDLKGKRISGRRSHLRNSNL